MFAPRTGNRITDESLRHLHDRIVIIEGIVTMPGNFVTGVALPNGVPVDIRHFLRRRWVGYHRASLRGAVTGGFVVDEDSPNDIEFLRLRATGFGATISVSLWIY